MAKKPPIQRKVTVQVYADGKVQPLTPELRERLAVYGQKIAIEAQGLRIVEGKDESK